MDADLETHAVGLYDHGVEFILGPESEATILRIV